MSEAVLDPSAAPGAQSSRLPVRRSARNQLNALEALERGFALFQSTFSREAWRCYAGTTPFVVFFILIWVVDGQIRISNGTLLMEAVLLTAAYVARTWLATSYVQRVRQRAFGVQSSKPARSAGGRMAAMGRLLSWKISLSVAALATLPTIAGASWFYSACQFATLEAPDDVTERHSFSGCLRLSSQCFGSGLLLFLMLVPLWIAVWLNGLLLAGILPRLLHSIFGVNTLLSTGMGMDALLLSSAFWLALFAAAWVALDPIVKCTYVIVYQHLRSRREGDDLRGLLATLPREQQRKAEMIAPTGIGRSVRIGAAIGLALILPGLSQTTRAVAAQSVAVHESSAAPGDSARSERVQKLRQAVSEESRREIYQWHDSEHPAAPTWLDKLLAKIGHAIGSAWYALQNFLRKLWPSGLNLSMGSGKGGRMKDVRLWLTLLAVLTAIAGAALFWLRRRRQAAELSIPISAAPLPDLSDAAVASERSEEEWFALAMHLENQGELRLALRATYLGLLAGLAQREWLVIRRDRTNREYLEEFTRRWRRRPQAAIELRAEIPEKLRGTLRLFDRVWYGSYALTATVVAAYRKDQRELLSHV